MRVLLIEDHPSLSEAMVHAIARGGYAVDHATTVKLASQMAEMTDYALIILDLGLPDGDGLELLPKLRKQGSVPVIILTAREELSARLAGLDGGADDYIVKPVEMSELLARCIAVSPNALEASVSRLRRALADAGCELAIITVRGVGWMLPQKNTSK